MGFLLDDSQNFQGAERAALYVKPKVLWTWLTEVITLLIKIQEKLMTVKGANSSWHLNVSNERRCLHMFWATLKQAWPSCDFWPTRILLRDSSCMAFRQGLCYFSKTGNCIRLQDAREACKSCGWEILYNELASMNCSNELLLQPRSLHLGRIQLLYLIIKATHTQKKNLGENRSDAPLHSPEYLCQVCAIWWDWLNSAPLCLWEQGQRSTSTTILLSQLRIQGSTKVSFFLIINKNDLPEVDMLSLITDIFFWFPSIN